VRGFAPSFHRDGSTLACDGVPLETIAAAHGTPSYVYSARAIEEAYREIERALAFERGMIAYAVKANDNLAVLAKLAKLGAGADIVSGGELRKALRARFAPDRIVYSGVGKNDEEIELALTTGIRAIHVESEPELDAIAAAAEKRGSAATISLRINPDVDAKTHPYIATGIHGTKFGLELATARRLVPRIVGDRWLRLTGVAIHIGSQVTSTEPLEQAVFLAAEFAGECRKAGAPIESVDAGGGWPIAYGNETGELPGARANAAAIRRGLERAAIGDVEVVIEPGRAIIGNAGVLLTRVLFVKEELGKRFAIVDAAMTELLRPTLYGAHHHIEPVTGAAREEVTYEIVGPVCETGDYLARGRVLPRVEKGDLLAIFGAGAYGAVMSSRYNARRRAPELLVENGQARVVRERERYEDLWRNEHE
jgi:diaminopimelate decarboxylase